MAKVKVKLFADCYVGGKIRKKGCEVSLSEEIAKDFGEIVKDVPKEQSKPVKKAEK